MALYNWSAEAWVELDEPQFGDNPIAATERLVSSDGRVRVRLSVGERSQGSCYMVEVGFEGQR
jgi:hypothetical protein